MLGEAETLGERLESGDATADKVAIGLDYLRKRLLDLTLRNAMLAYPMPSRASRGTKTNLQVIDAEPDTLYDQLWQEKELAWQALPEPPDPQRPLMDLAAYARTHGIDPSLELSQQLNDAPRHGDRGIQALLLPDELERRLRKIYTEARSAEEETGANMLYLVFGFLRWRESETSETDRYAPLVMLPVKLQIGSNVCPADTAMSLPTSRGGGSGIGSGNTPCPSGQRCLTR